MAKKKAAKGTATKTGRVAARRRPREDGEYPSTLSLKKVMKTAESFGLDPDGFMRAYMETVVPRGRVTHPTDEQREAVKQFLANGDIEELLEAAGVKTPQAALRLVSVVRGGG